MHRSLEWAAGLFEGEGCMTWRDKEHKRPYLKLTMTDFDVVQQFAKIVNCGSLTSVDKKKSNWKNQLLWRTTSQKDVVRILSAFLPYFGNRRAYKALNILDSLELV